MNFSGIRGEYSPLQPLEIHPIGGRRADSFDMSEAITRMLADMPDDERSAIAAVLLQMLGEDARALLESFSSRQGMRGSEIEGLAQLMASDDGLALAIGEAGPSLDRLRALFSEELNERFKIEEGEASTPREMPPRQGQAGGPEDQLLQEWYPSGEHPLCKPPPVRSMLENMQNYLGNEIHNADIRKLTTDLEPSFKELARLSDKTESELAREMGLPSRSRNADAFSYVKGLGRTHSHGNVYSDHVQKEVVDLVYEQNKLPPILASRLLGLNPTTISSKWKAKHGKLRHILERKGADELCLAFPGLGREDAEGLVELRNWPRGRAFPKRRLQAIMNRCPFIQKVDFSQILGRTKDFVSTRNGFH